VKSGVLFGLVHVSLCTFPTSSSTSVACVNSPRVNRTLLIEFNCEKSTLNLLLIF
jgi:hypothetical protein